MSPRLVAFLLIATCHVSIALAGHGPQLPKVAESASLAEEGDLILSHLRGRTPEMGVDDIWDNSTLPDLRCTSSTEGRSGCSEAPACDNVGKCTEKEMTCSAYKWTGCRGCFQGAPSCPSGYSCQYVEPRNSDFKHQGGGVFCSLVCCYRIGDDDDVYWH